MALLGVFFLIPSTRMLFLGSLVYLLTKTRSNVEALSFIEKAGGQFDIFVRAMDCYAIDEF